MSVSYDLPYELRRNPALPWGYWIVIDTEGHRTKPLVDDHGRRWNSLREALWIGRLSMTGGEKLSRVDVELLEFLLAVLAMIDRSVVCVSGVVADLFDNSWARTAHYGSWLAGQALIDQPSLRDAQLSPEGRAVLVMLASTRPTDRRTMPIGFNGLHPFTRLRPDPDHIAMEAVIRTAEMALPKDMVRFFRKDTMGRPSIVLVATADAKLPLAEVLWSITFAQTYQRDRLYAWLLAQPDRWEGWLAIAREQRKGALTEHLLTLFVAQDCEERGI